MKHSGAHHPLAKAALLATVACAMMACDHKTPMAGDAWPSSVTTQAPQASGGIEPGNLIRDTVIAMNIHTALITAPKLSTLAIDVTSQNGVVLLTGTAPDVASREHASSLAGGVNGVVWVENQLAISDVAPRE